MIRLGSTVDQFAQRGQTEPVVRAAIAKVPVPEGRYGSLRLRLNNMQSHPHESLCGMVVWCGTLVDFAHTEQLLDWWSDVVLAIGDERNLGVAHGALQYGVDGQPWITVDHIAAIKRGLPLDEEGAETLGDDET